MKTNDLIELDLDRLRRLDLGEVSIAERTDVQIKYLLKLKESHNPSKVIEATGKIQTLFGPRLLSSGSHVDDVDGNCVTARVCLQYSRLSFNKPALASVVPRRLSTITSYPVNAASLLAAEMVEAAELMLAAERIEYDQYARVLSSISHPNIIEASGIWQSVKDSNFLGTLGILTDYISKYVKSIASHLKMSIDEVVVAFKSKQMFEFLKSIHFNFSKLLVPLKAFTKVYRDGLIRVAGEIYKTKAWQAVRSGAMTVDEFLERYPLIKRLSGPAVAGLLVWMWLSANFTGDPDLDMDMTAAIKAAIHGNFSVTDLFTSPEGVVALTLLFSSLSGLSWPSPAWLNSDVPLNILTALIYTGYKHMKRSPAVTENLSRLKHAIHFERAV